MPLVFVVAACCAAADVNATADVGEIGTAGKTVDLVDTGELVINLAIDSS